MKWIRHFKRVPYFFQQLYEKVTTSIAFYPTLMALGFFLLSGLMIYGEKLGLTAWMEQRFPPFLFIKSWQIAQSILTTLIGALISLMVFSFSMVMVLLNNAATNFSPRILPKLIANKFHQFVLGFYLGTITYGLILTINLKPSNSDIPLPGLSILLGIFLGLTCLMLFVFFIHSISESVQVGNILENLRNTTLDNIRKMTHENFAEPTEATRQHFKYTYPADRSGYLKSVDGAQLDRIAQEADLLIRVLIPQSKFVIEGADLFVCNRELEEDLLSQILGSFVFLSKEYAATDHVIGFKQITEIAVKAMSPGINDPGTALTAIDQLSVLFVEKMKLPLSATLVIEGKENEEGKKSTRIWISIVSFDELLTFVLAPLRQYARHDLVVMLKMLEMLEFLNSRKHCHASYRQVILREMEIVRMDAQKYLTNPADYARALDFINTEKQIRQ